MLALHIRGFKVQSLAFKNDNPNFKVHKDYRKRNIVSFIKFREFRYAICSYNLNQNIMASFSGELLREMRRSKILIIFTSH